MYQLHKVAFMTLDEQRLLDIRVVLAAIFGRKNADVSLELQDDGAFLLAAVRFQTAEPVDRSAINAATALLNKAVLFRPDNYAWMINFVDAESIFDSESGGWSGHR